MVFRRGEECGDKWACDDDDESLNECLGVSGGFRGLVENWVMLDVPNGGQVGM